MDDFLIRALIGGIGVAIISGPLGCLVVWQRMTYFGAALSHAALLGVALGFFLEINPALSILLVSILVSCLLLLMERYHQLASDTTLGILAHGALAIGVIILGLMPTLRIDLMSYLFGDILTIDWKDVIWIYLGGVTIMLILALIWRPLLSLIIQKELALVDGIKETRIRVAFLFLLSISIAVSMQVVGILLIVSLLIIPAAAARRFSTSPEQMAIFSIVVGVTSVVLGLWMSLGFDTPAGPSMVFSASVIFGFSFLAKKRN
ncbi:MAG: iron chelate uptake ABC transporter family permease subunit [Gammaproteobacteria bacterium]|nr:iron chelate uptake ABC transporter family permease subunit [Gammaproteobacteria bacterium]